VGSLQGELEVFVLGDLVGLPDDLLVVQAHVVLLYLAIGRA
jgi:hypothetical protein